MEGEGWAGLGLEGLEDWMDEELELCMGVGKRMVVCVDPEARRSGKALFESLEELFLSPSSLLAHTPPCSPESLNILPSISSSPPSSTPSPSPGTPRWVTSTNPP